MSWHDMYGHLLMNGNHPPGNQSSNQDGEDLFNQMMDAIGKLVEANMGYMDRIDQLEKRMSAALDKLDAANQLQDGVQDNGGSCRFSVCG